MSSVAPGILIGLTLLIAAAWTTLICIPSGWQVKSTIIVDFNLGLHHAKVTKAIGGHLLSGIASGADSVTGAKKMKASDVVDFFTEDESTIQHYRDTFCNLGVIIPQNCKVWNDLLIASWVMMFTAIITVILLFSASGMYYFYHNNEALTRIRQWSIGLFAVAPCVAIGGTATYAFLTFQFSHWLEEFNLASASTWTFGLCSMMAAFVALLTVIPVIIIAACGKQDEKEFFAEGEAEERGNLCYGGEQGYGTAQAPYQDPYAQPGYCNPAQQQGYPPQQQAYGQYPQQGY